MITIIKNIRYTNLCSFILLNKGNNRQASKHRKPPMPSSTVASRCSLCAFNFSFSAPVKLSLPYCSVSAILASPVPTPVNGTVLISFNTDCHTNNLACVDSVDLVSTCLPECASIATENLDPLG